MTDFDPEALSARFDIAEPLARAGYQLGLWDRHRDSYDPYDPHDRSGYQARGEKAAAEALAVAEKHVSAAVDAILQQAGVAGAGMSREVLREFVAALALSQSRERPPFSI